MADFTVWMLAATQISVSGGKSLSGLTQGDGSHLLGQTITLTSNGWTSTKISDNDATFDDNDTTQKLSGAQSINGTTYASGTMVEAEYKLVLQDPTGKTWTVYGYNVNNSNPSYATIEGLSFFGGEGGFPPVGVALKVISTSEGPGSSGQPTVGYDKLAFPPCLTPGTMIATPDGARAIETLKAGDLVLTRDAGAQPLVWVGALTVPGSRLRMEPQFRPVRISAGALGPGVPSRDLVVSQQHRMLITGWQAELMAGCPEVLVAARHLVGRPGIRIDEQAAEVTYLHLLFDRHHLIWADGAETESFRPTFSERLTLSAAQWKDVLALFPELAGGAGPFATPVRPCLRAWETAATVAAGRRKMVRAKGLEPPRLSAPEPKSGASTSFATPARGSH